MPTKTEIIEAGARAALNAARAREGYPEVELSDLPNPGEWREDTEAALTAMLPLIKEQLAADVRKHKRRVNDGNDVVREQAARIIEWYEP